MPRFTQEDSAGDEFLHHHTQEQKAIKHQAKHTHHHQQHHHDAAAHKKKHDDHHDGGGEEDDNATSPSHAYDDDDDEREMTEEEKDWVAVRCLRLFNVLLMLIGGGLCGASLWATTSTVAGIGTSLMYAVAGVGGGVFIVTLIGLIGALVRAQQILLFYHTCLIFASFAMLVLGGFCFILYKSAVVWVQDNWVYLLQSLPPAQRAEMNLEKYSGFLTYAMFSVGAVALLLLTFLLCAMSNVIRLVTPLKGYTLLLQATNTTLLPVGIALMGIGIWVADTAIGQEAVFSAFSIFVLGMLVIFLIMIGCTSISLRSRGLIRLFCFITSFLTAAFLAFGVTSLVASDKVDDAIIGQWQLLRRILPSSFAGKYDVEQFSAFVNSNLRALGFFALCTGILMGTQTFGAVRLRFELKAASELSDQAVEAHKDGLLTQEDLDALLQMRAPGRLEKLWKSTWTNGSKVSRTAVVFCLLFTCFVFLVVVGVAIAALYYSTMCTTMSAYAESFDYDNRDVGALVKIENNYTRGVIQVKVGSASSLSSGSNPSTTFEFRKSAFSKEMAAPGYPSLETVVGPWTTDVYGGGIDADVTYTHIQSFPAPATRYLNFEVSCQDATMSLTLPSAAVLGGNGYDLSAATPYAVNLVTGGDQTAIVMNWKDVLVGMRPRLYRIDVATDAGSFEATGVLVGAKGMKADSDLGEFILTSIDAQCDASDLGGDTGGIRLATNKGAVSILSSIVRDCDVYIRGGAARCAVSDSILVNTLGGSKLTMEGTDGALFVSNTQVDLLGMTGEGGSVRLSNVTIGQSLKVSTSSGKVDMQALVLATRAGIQVDTDVGSVEIWANKFAGIVSVVTGGTISCVGTGFDITGTQTTPCSSLTEDTSADGTVLRVLEQVNVNCAARGDCPYLGGITITSARGNVVLRMDKWTR